MSIQRSLTLIVGLLALVAQVSSQSAIQQVIDDTYIFDLTRLDGIQYSPQWYLDAYDSRRKGGTLHTSISAASNLVYFFQGNAIHYYADRDVPHGPARVYLDNDNQGVEVLSNATSLLYQQLLWSATGLGPGDHQLVISHAGANQQYVGLDYLLVESDHGFTPLLAGPAASIVPPEAVFVDDDDLSLNYSVGWDAVLPSQNQATYFRNTMHRTNTPGANVTLKFNGTAVWYFTDLQPEHGKLNITVDDKQSWIIYGNTGQQMQQRMIWNVTGLPYGEHKVVLTHYDVAGTYMTLDFFRYLPGTPPSAKGSSPIGAIVGGVVGGVVLLSLGGALIVFICRRRDRSTKSYFDHGKLATPPLLNSPHVPEYGYVSQPFPGNAGPSEPPATGIEHTTAFRRAVKGQSVAQLREPPASAAPALSVVSSDWTQATSDNSLHGIHPDNPPPAYA